MEARRECHSDTRRGVCPEVATIVGGYRLPLRLPLVFEGQLEAPALLYETEFLFAGEPADAHKQEALRKGRAALELVECHCFMLDKIPPNPTCCLANLCVHRIFLPPTAFAAHRL